MTLAAEALSATWTFVDGDWHEGNVAILGPRSHAMWLGTSVFDGGRWFEGVAPDLDRHARGGSLFRTSNLGGKGRFGISRPHHL